MTSPNTKQSAKPATVAAPAPQPAVVTVQPTEVTDRNAKSVIALRDAFRYQLSATFVPTPKRAALFGDEKSKVHDALVVQALRGQPPTTLADLLGRIDVGRYKTKDPLAYSVRWHLRKLEKEGTVKAIPIPLATETKAA